MENRFLCRGKRSDTGEWVEGFPFLVNDVSYILPHHNTGQPIHIDNLLSTSVEVSKATICQCTGLKDKNGKLIWETDILMCHGNSEDLVKAAFGEFNVINAETLEVIDRVIGWHYEVVPTDALSKCEPFCLPMPLTEEYVKTCEMEVVDNPELLEV
mgnify:CR=1 FL=1|jgi:hypothetical protein|nr:MAG TPA: YopX protein [Caudoviricetes sp.]